MRTRPDLNHAPLRTEWREGASLLAWLGFVVGLETIGPSLGLELGLVVGLLVGFALARTTARVHARAPITWLRLLGQGARWFLPRQAPWRLELGLDLRASPPVPRAWPAILAVPLVLLSVGVLAVAPHAGRFPGVLTELAERSFVLYSLAIGTLLAALFAGGGLLTVFGLVILRERLRRSAPHLIWVALAVAGAASLPVAAGAPHLAWLPLIGPIAALAIAGLAFFWRGEEEAAMLWRPRRSPRPEHEPAGTESLASLPLLPFAGAQLALCGLAVLLLTLLSRGERIVGAEASEPVLVLRLLGWAFSWCGAYGCLALAYVVSRVLRARFAAWRSERAGLRVYLDPSGALAHGPAERRALAATLAEAGFRAHFGPRPEHSRDLAVVLVDEAMEDRVPDAWPAQEPSLTAPITVGALELPQPPTLARLRRLAVRSQRVRLLRGLKKLMRAAKHQAPPRGEGLWLGPQHWFLSGLGRDRQSDEDALREGLFEPRLGPSYAETLDWAARHHFGKVCRDLEIDLVFVQDGVRFNGLRRVLETLFELHDVFGGERRAEERDFSGLVGLRVVLHDFELGQPFRKEGYPEPEYEDLARARILHVFKDKGGLEETLDAPTDLVDLPAPVLVH